MRRDESRENMPEGSCYNLVDYFPDRLGAPLTKRGGWTYASNTVGSTYVVGGAWAPFTAAAKNCALDSAGELYTVAPDGTVTDAGAGTIPKAALAFHRNTLILTGSDGATVPKAYTGSGVPATLAGSPPPGVYGAVYKDRTVLGGTAAAPQRVFFSPAGNPAGTWDTATSWVDADYPVSGVASLRNALLIFSTFQVERIIGATPPPGSDMARQPLFQPGCIDARSIVIADDTCYFANPTGLYQTDGAAILDVTEKGGMKRYWQELFAGYTSTWTVTGVRLRNWVVYSVMDGATFKDGFAVDITSRVWVRLANMKFLGAWQSIEAAPESFFGWRGGPRVGRLSSLFSPGAAVKNDADGVPVAPQMETAWFPLGASKAQIRDIYAAYDIRDAATDQPVLTLGYLLSPESLSYTTVVAADGTSPYPLAETAEYTRVRRNVRKSGFGIALRLTQSNASQDTRLYRLEADTHKREPTRL